MINLDAAFAGFGLALRRKDEAPIPGEPLMSIADAKEICRGLLAEQSARIEADKAALVEALDSVMVGGNHLANVLISNLGAGFPERFPPDMNHGIARTSICSIDDYEVWCCWRSIMNARATLAKHGGDK